MRKDPLYLAVLATCVLACASPSSPDLGKVEVTVEGLTLFVTTTERLVMEKFAMHVTSGEFRGIIAAKSDGDIFVGLIEQNGRDVLFRNTFVIPDGTSTLKLSVIGGRGQQVRLETNPAEDWLVRNKEGNLVRLPNKYLQLNLTTSVKLLANGREGQVTVPLGTCVTLSWKSQNSVTCSATCTCNYFIGLRTLAGSELVCPTTETDFKVVCYEFGGSSAESEVKIIPR